MSWPCWLQSVVTPCLTCEPCRPEKDNLPGQQRRQSKQRSRRPTLPRPLQLHNGRHRVELVCSPLAGLQGLAGYHSSVLVDGEEYYFTPSGIRCFPRLTSHRRARAVQRKQMGESPLGGTVLLDVLSKDFQPQTYDLLRKNCNNFTDCGLLLLTGQRLDAHLRLVEGIGVVAETLNLVQILSGGRYEPNDKAEGYDHEETIAALHEHRKCLGLEDPDEEPSKCRVKTLLSV